jgi:Porin subfamily
MRKTFLIVIVAGWPAFVLAQQAGDQKSGKAPASGKLLPLKGATRNNSCAEFGAGFVKVEGSDTCVKVGGYVSTGAGGYMGAR